MGRPCLPSPSVGVDRGRRCWALRGPEPPNNVALKRGVATHGLCGGLGNGEALFALPQRGGRSRAALLGTLRTRTPQQRRPQARGRDPRALWRLGHGSVEAALQSRPIHSASQRSAIAWK